MSELNLTFKKVILLSALVVLLGVSIVYALLYELKPNSSTQTLSQAVGVNEQVGLKLILTLEKTEYSLGEPVNMTLTLTNIKNQTVSFDYFYNWWDFRVYNVASSGQNDLYIGDGGHDMLPHGGEVSLGSGMNMTDGFSWQQVSNSTLDRYGQPISPVLPGTYYILGMYDDFGRDFDYNLQTAPLKITII